MDDLEKMSQDIGERIKTARNSKKMSQQELAVKADISLPHISHIEHGKINMKLVTFVKIIEALQVSADTILRADVPSVNLLYQNEFSEIFADCSPAETAALIKIVMQVKETMRLFTDKE